MRVATAARLTTAELLSSVGVPWVDDRGGAAASAHRFRGREDLAVAEEFKAAGRPDIRTDRDGGVERRGVGDRERLPELLEAGRGRCGDEGRFGLRYRAVALRCPRRRDGRVHRVYRRQPGRGWWRPRGCTAR